MSLNPEEQAGLCGFLAPSIKIVYPHEAQVIALLWWKTFSCIYLANGIKIDMSERVFKKSGVSENGQIFND